MRPWGILGAPSSVEPVSPPSTSGPDSATAAAASLETWSPNFKSLPIYEQMDEIHDHVTRAVAEAATARAEVQELRETLDRTLALDMPPYFRDRLVPQTDMTGEAK